MHCNKLSFQEPLHYFGNNLDNKFEINTWNMNHNAETLQDN